METAGHAVEKSRDNRLDLPPDDGVVGTRHADVGDIARPFRQNTGVGGHDVGMGSQDRTDPPVQVAAEGDFFGGRLSVNLHDHHIHLNLKLRNQAIGRPERAIPRLHELASENGEEAQPPAGRFEDQMIPPGAGRIEIGRPADPFHLSDHDLKPPLVPDVIAEGQAVRTGGEDLLGQSLRDAGPGRGILAVGHDQIDVQFLAQPGQTGGQSCPAGATDDITDKENLEHADDSGRARRRGNEESAGESGLASDPTAFILSTFLTAEVMKSATTVASFPKPEIGPEMKGAEIVIECLVREGVDTVFAYPGGASMELHQALAKSTAIRTVLPRHEQGGAFAAEGYARATGKAGVCMATSGPGATNLVTAIADAFMDSTPLVAITGQVYQKFIGKSAFQETDFFGMTLPVVKHSYLILDVNDIPHVIKEAFLIAQTGRPGPVVVDIPKDVQQAVARPAFPPVVELRSSKLPTLATDEELKHLLGLIGAARRPVLYVGGGVISAEASADLKAFAERARIPVATTLMGVGAFPETHPLSMKWFGMHGSAYGNWAVHQSDLLLAFGARFDDRITGDPTRFAPEASIVHIDIDASEHNKNKRVAHPIVSEIGYALRRMNDLMEVLKFKAPDTEAWLAKIDAWKRDYPFKYGQSKHILPQEAIRTLYELTKGEAIITTGVGQHQMWAAQFYNFDNPRCLISSLGLGSMGFGYPAAIGAKTAFPDRQVVDIDGDGSFLMNVQELATANIEKIGAKAMVLNNQHLGMVVQWEDRFYNSVRGHTILGDASNIGTPENLGGLYPDFVAIARGFGVAARRVHLKSELREAVQEMLDCDGPFLLDVIVPYNEHVIPMIPASQSVDEMIIE